MKKATTKHKTAKRVKIARKTEKPAKTSRKAAKQLVKKVSQAINAKANKPKAAKTRRLTKEQRAGVDRVINVDSFEGEKRIDHLPLNRQIDTVFNPFHTISKTTVTKGMTESTYVVVADDNE